MSASIEPRPLGTGARFGRLARSIRSRLGQLFEHGADLFTGVDTAGIIETPDLVVDSDNKARGIRYQPTSAWAFRRLLRELQLPRDAVFVDIGCGKGRVLLLAQRHGFRKVIGIDYAAALCETARRNLARAARRASNSRPATVHCQDAADYAFEADETVVYLFNPFDAHVLRSMLDRLAQSLHRAPRKAWLIYHFPRWHETIEAQGVFRLSGVHRHAGCEFAVFVHDPATPARPTDGRGADGRR